MAAPNIVNVSTITGKTAVLNVSTSATEIANNSVDSGKVYKINSLIVSNIEGANTAEVTVDVYRNDYPYHLASTITIPADATLVVISKETALYLEEGDLLRCTASVDNYLQAVCSYEEIS